jgi:hypothetical protein
MLGMTGKSYLLMVLALKKCAYLQNYAHQNITVVGGGGVNSLLNSMVLFFTIIKIVVSNNVYKFLK